MTVRDNVQTLQGSNFEAGQLLTLGDPVFLSENAISDQETVFNLAEFYRAVHVTAYGQPIPNTAGTVSHTTTAVSEIQTVLETSSNNQVMKIMGVEIVNASVGTPVTVVVCSSTVGIHELLVAPSTTSYLSPVYYPTVLKGANFGVNQVDGVLGDITVNVSYCLVVQ